MSLINKVLRDLEAQREPIDVAVERSALVHDELQPVRPVAPRLSRRWWLHIALLLALAAAGAFAWLQWSAEPHRAKIPVVSVATAPVPAASTPVSIAAIPAAELPKTGTVAARPTEPALPAKIAEAPKPTAGSVPASPPVRDLVVRKSQAESLKTEAVAPATPLTEAPAKTVTAKAKESTPPAAAPDADETEDRLVAKPKIPVAKPDETEIEKPVARAVLDKKVRPLTPEERAENEYRLAAAALQQRRSGEAESRLRTALAAQPGHVKARELLAGLLLQGGHWREAQSQLEQGLTLNPAHYPFAQLLARSYVDHGQEGKALELLEKKREAAGGDADYFAFLATLCQRAGRHDDAIRAFGEALGRRPQEGRWWLGLAISLEAVEKWKEATEAYQRAAVSGSLDRQLLQYSQRRLAVVRSK